MAPVIALLATAAAKNMNQQGKEKAVFILDEAPTLFIPGLEGLPATARSNRVATILGVQNFAQLESLYSHSLAKAIRSNLANQFFGMSNNVSTSEYVAKMAGEYTSVKTTWSKTWQSDTISRSLEREAYLKAHQVALQPPGVGSLASILNIVEQPIFICLVTQYHS